MTHQDTLSHASRGSHSRGETDLSLDSGQGWEAAPDLAIKPWASFSLRLSFLTFKVEIMIHRQITFHSHTNENIFPKLDKGSENRYLRARTHKGGDGGCGC